MFRCQSIRIMQLLQVGFAQPGTAKYLSFSALLSPTWPHHLLLSEPSSVINIKYMVICWSFEAFHTCQRDSQNEAKLSGQGSPAQKRTIERVDEGSQSAW